MFHFSGIFVPLLMCMTVYEASNLSCDTGDLCSLLVQVGHLQSEYKEFIKNYENNKCARDQSCDNETKFSTLDGDIEGIQRQLNKTEQETEKLNVLHYEIRDQIKESETEREVLRSKIEELQEQLYRSQIKVNNQEIIIREIERKLLDKSETDKSYRRNISETFLEQQSNIDKLQQKVNETYLENDYLLNKLLELNQAVQDALTEIENSKNRKSESQSVTQPSTTPTCPKDWLYFTNSCYLFSQDVGVIFSSAQALCEQKSAHLVYVENEEENNFIKQHIINNGLIGSFWIGLSDEGHDGVWKYYGTEKEATFFNWHTGEPSYRNTLNHIENCVELRKDSKYNWNDLSCTIYPQNYICEKEM